MSVGDRPAKQSTLEGLHLGATQADVRFFKGESALDHSVEDRWIYEVGSRQSASAVLIVQFREAKVKQIVYWASDDQVVQPRLLGFGIGSKYEAVLEKLGAPSYCKPCKSPKWYPRKPAPVP